MSSVSVRCFAFLDNRIVAESRLQNGENENDSAEKYLNAVALGEEPDSFGV
jgi:hypothetical protein